MFGKSVGEYLGFQKVVLAVIFVVWLVRLVLSLATLMGLVMRRRSRRGPH